MMTLFITLLILLQLSVKISMQICEGIYGTKCCNGYKWDFSHSKCIPCDNGFIGINCDIKCRYPWYGKNCQSVCDCDVPNCDYVNGCTKPTTNYKVHSTLHTNDKTVTKEQIKIYDVFSIKACDHGFIWINCDTKCRYPTYGQDCQSECDCDVQNCHFVNGCTKSSTKYKVQYTIHTNDKTTTKEQTEIHNVSSDKDISNVTTDTTTNSTYPVYETKKTEPKKINTLMFGIIGLMTVSFIIYMMYLYTRLLEKRLVNSISQFR